jgi:hypothetical protein
LPRWAAVVLLFWRHCHGLHRPKADGELVRINHAPIPLRAGYWVQLAFHDARFKGGGLGDVSLSDVMESGLVGVARSTFHGSAQFESQAAALASPIVDVVVVPIMISPRS